jgi:hypothetical protein
MYAQICQNVSEAPIDRLNRRLETKEVVQLCAGFACTRLSQPTIHDRLYLFLSSTPAGLPIGKLFETNALPNFSAQLIIAGIGIATWLSTLDTRTPHLLPAFLQLLK